MIRVIDRKDKLRRICQVFYLYLTIQMLVFGVSCSKSNSQIQNTNTITQAEKRIQSIKPSLDTSIREIDFANMTYTTSIINLDSKKKHFKLKDGIYKEKLPDGGWLVPYTTIGLLCVIYGDVTDDGRDDAIVVLVQDNEVQAQPHFIYIFTLIDKKPKIIWAHGAGSEGNGGIKIIKIEDGVLVIELFGKGTAVEESLDDQDEKSYDCCPKYFTQSRYQWNGKDFKSIYKEAFHNLSGVYSRFSCQEEQE